MKHMSKVITILFIVFFIICQSPTIAPNPLASSIPFVMEMLDYTLYWGGVEVGSAKFQVSRDDKGLKILSIVLSNELVSTFYKVENIIQSALNSEGYPLYYKLKLNQGKRTRDREVFFDYKNELVRSIDKERNKERTYKMTKKYHDPLSGLFELRRRDIAVGTTEVIPFFDKKRFYEAHVEVLRKERIETDYSQFDTIVVHPRLKSEGIFTSKSDILIWLTDDEEKIPVKIEAKIKIGTITAYLKGDR